RNRPALRPRAAPASGTPSATPRARPSGRPRHARAGAGRRRAWHPDAGGPTARARWQRRGRSLLEPSQQAVHEWRTAAHDRAATDQAAQARDAGLVGEHQVAEIETEQARRDRQRRTEPVEQVDTILGQAAFEAKNGGLAIAITGDAEHEWSPGGDTPMQG